MEADALFRDVSEGVVQRVDAELRELAVRGNVHVRVNLPGVRQVRVVYLQEEACVDDDLVLDGQGIGDGEEELFLRGVVLVLEPVLHGAGGDGGQVDFRRGCSLKAGAEVVDVRLHVGVTDVADGADAHRLIDAVLPGGRRRAVGTDLEVLREILEVAPTDSAHARSVRVHGPNLQTVQALAHIVAEAGLADLAVVDAVDAVLHLQPDVLCDDAPHVGGELRVVHLLAAALGHYALSDVSGPGQRSGVHGEDPVCAPKHVATPLCNFKGSHSNVKQ